MNFNNDGALTSSEEDSTAPLHPSPHLTHAEDERIEELTHSAVVHHLRSLSSLLSVNSPNARRESYRERTNGTGRKRRPVIQWHLRKATLMRTLGSDARTATAPPTHRRYWPLAQGAPGSPTSHANGDTATFFTLAKDWYYTLMRSKMARRRERAMAMELRRAVVVPSSDVQSSTMAARLPPLYSMMDSIDGGTSNEKFEESLRVEAAFLRASGGRIRHGASHARADGSVEQGEDLDVEDKSTTLLQRMSQWVEGCLPAFRHASFSELIRIWCLMVLLVVGGAMQIIMLNFWLHQYPSTRKPGNYTTFAVSSVVFAVFFDALLVLHLIIDRPSLAFVWTRRGASLLVAVGTADMLASALTIYAASHTSEVLQALFSSAVPIFTAFFQKHLLHDPRRYTNSYVLTSFALIAAGVLIASYSSWLPSRRGEAESGQLLWSFAFFCSVIPSVLQNVVQTRYMIAFTHDPLFEKWFVERNCDSLETASPLGDGAAHDTECLAPGDVGEGMGLLDGARTTSVAYGSCGSVQQRTRKPSDECFSHPAFPTWTGGGERDAVNSFVIVDEDANESSVSICSDNGHLRVEYGLAQGSDLTVKLVLLAADTTIQAVEALLLLPMDALPYWGTSTSVSEAVGNFHDGMHCLATCPNNLLYGLMYCLGFIFTYVGAAYLDQVNVTLCSMVSQLAAPCTALLLLIYPSLNLSDDYSPWYVSVCAVVLLTTGALVYTVWDQRTSMEKLTGENQLKCNIVRPWISRIPCPV